MLKSLIAPALSVALLLPHAAESKTPEVEFSASKANFNKSIAVIHEGVVEIQLGLATIINRPMTCGKFVLSLEDTRDIAEKALSIVGFDLNEKEYLLDQDSDGKVTENELNLFLSKTSKAFKKSKKQITDMVINQYSIILEQLGPKACSYYFPGEKERQIPLHSSKESV